jgi:hypothetical protein
VEALAVPDHVPGLDPELRHEPERELQGRVHLPGVAEHLGIGTPDVLDSEGELVHPDRVATSDPERHELVDPAVRVHDEMRARARVLPEVR